ncbi:Tat proofreading chaperone DmsD [Plesiomonas shigelloides]|uniref:Tat proofreading chaperone DmsD n=1 Tax=Plesiomonas shigelloides TaxID=703 RepID=UPI001C5B255C|nr:Tat proofreading chaperone DmsD [Plesiomonas shigelloides]
MSSLAVIPRLLGVLFYCPPTDPQFQAALGVLDEVKGLLPASCQAQAAPLLRQLPALDEALLYQHSVLFIGQGSMPAPPWGSVYLDHEGLLMGDSTLAYRQFLQQCGLQFTPQQHEPEDHFGLMLMTLALLAEQQQTAQVQLLLAEHLLPWAYAYLDALIDSGESTFYQELGQLARIYLHDLAQTLDVTVANKPLFR